ncbi:MAG: hypothetical protein OCU12_03690 [Methanophagales archaeon]|nr:hypothetical protein [Methanophagales archaeon]
MILKNRGEGKRKGVGAILVLAVFVGTAAFAPLSAGSGVGGFSGFGEVSEFSSEGNGSTLAEWTQNHTVNVNSTTTWKYEQGVLRLNETYTGAELRERFGVERFTKELEIPVEGREAETLGLEEGEEKEFVAEKEVVLTREEEPPHWWDEYDYPQWAWLKSGEIYEQNLPINIAWKGTTKNRAKSEILEEEGWVDDPVEYTEYVYDREKGWIRDDGVADSKYGVFGRNHTLLWQLSDGNVVANAHHDDPFPHKADELEEAEERVAGFFGEPEDTEWRVHEDSYDLGNSVTTPHSNGLCTEINYKYVPEEEWSKTFGGSDYDFAMSVQQTTDGGYIIAGSTDSYGAGSYDFWLVKTDSDGNKEWDKTFGGSDYDWAESVQQTTDGGYIIAGFTRSYGAGDRDFWLVKTDANGNKEWDKTFGGSDYDFASSVQQTADGGYIIAGSTASYGAGDKDFWLVKVKGEEPTEPEISIQTDKREYSPGETMTVTLGFKNPTASSVKANFIWYLDWLPILSTALTLPPKCEQSYEFSIPVGEWSPVGFEAAWYVALLEQAAPHETICEDSAAWRFVPTAATTATKTTAATTTQTQVPKEVAEQIARELEVEREEFAAA